MLGTATEVSIYNEHILQRAKKEIKKANKLGEKVTKVLAKYQGPDISEAKEIAELKGVLRAYQELTGNKEDIPDNVEAILAMAKECEEEFNEIVKAGEARKATVFLKDEKGWPIISTHMIIGNCKENLKIIVNNGDKTKIKYKTVIGEVMALDIKPIDEFMIPSKDILKNEKGERVLDERSIRFNRMGKEETAIALSEQIPEGATFGTTLRIRKNSPIDKELLEQLFDMGKNNGLGCWRGSGNRGAYLYKLEYLPEFKEVFEDGWK